jgi:hypothetical protein
MGYVSSVLGKDTIARTKGHPGNPAIIVHSTMPRYGHEYVLKALMKDESGTARESEKKEYIGKFYDEDGEVQLQTLSRFVNDLFHDLDSPSESSNGDSKKDS